MIRSIWNSRSGMSAQMDRLDAISNNMSNVNTSGYKRVDVSFNNLMQETLKRDGYPVENNVGGEDNLPFTGTGVKSSEFQKDNAQGNLIQTNKNTDLALDGEGFFKVIDSNGREAYIRSGNFHIDVQGTVVDNNGNRLVILDGRGNNANAPGISFTEKDFIVDENGNLLGNKNKNLRIPVFKTMGSNSMKSVGENLYMPDKFINERGVLQQVAVSEVHDTNILQGFVEGSNVDLGHEMTNMIITQRAFQLNSNALKTADEMWQMINNLRGR